MASFLDNIIFIKAESEFRTRAKEFCAANLPVNNLEVLAQHKAKLADFLPMELRAQLRRENLQNASEETKKGVQHLLALPETRLLRLLEKELPGHVEVLRCYPGYGSQILHEIIGLLAAT